jgi:hypothetical protein
VKSSKLPLVSVVIPTFNRAAVLTAALNSVLRQTFQELEVIVVDDGSRDATSETVLRVAQSDPRVRLIRNESNRGAQAARNTGIRASVGRWIAFLDSDDTWVCDSLKVRINAAQSGDVEVVHSPGFVLRFGGDAREKFEVAHLSGNVYRELLRGPNPLFPALLVSATALQAIGGLDESIVAYQEWETAICLARRFEFAFVSEPTFVYDCRGTDTISRNLVRGAKGYEQILRKHLRDIALLTGPRSVSKHYAWLSSEYRMAGDQRASRRCRYMSYVWWPNPHVPLRKIRKAIGG